jgi:hypothetical protein
MPDRKEYLDRVAAAYGQRSPAVEDEPTPEPKAKSRSKKKAAEPEPDAVAEE